jgi:hypothetical protein
MEDAACYSSVVLMQVQQNLGWGFLIAQWVNVSEVLQTQIVAVIIFYYARDA